MKKINFMDKIILQLCGSLFAIATILLVIAYFIF